MIQSIVLRNFQAHKNTEISLDKGITAIVGSSDSGKTSILRAFYWVLQNKPSGIQMVSYWNRK
jgi:exonuclease SbcC